VCDDLELDTFLDVGVDGFATKNIINPIMTTSKDGHEKA
jgi:hypothetical protein